MLSPPLAIGPQRKTILATAVALHHLAATIVATHRDNSATARCGEDAGRILAASNSASPRRWHRCGSRDQNQVARLVHRDGSRGVRHPTGRCPLAAIKAAGPQSHRNRETDDVSPGRSACRTSRENRGEQRRHDDGGRDHRVGTPRVAAVKKPPISRTWAEGVNEQTRDHG